MSLAASSFKAFRSCTAALAAPSTLVRPAGHCAARFSRPGARCYSEQKVSEDKSSSAQKGDATSSNTEVDPTAELKAKLKVKEDEVVNLTVRILSLVIVGQCA